MRWHTILTGRCCCVVRQQVDLAREAAQLSRFNYNFRHVRSVSFPRPVYPLVHPEVLVETFEAGQSVARYVERAAAHDHAQAQQAQQAQPQASGNSSSGKGDAHGGAVNGSEAEADGDLVLSDRDGTTPAVRDAVSLELAELGCLTLLKMMLVRGRGGRKGGKRAGGSPKAPEGDNDQLNGLWLLRCVHLINRTVEWQRRFGFGQPGHHALEVVGIGRPLSSR